MTKRDKLTVLRGITAISYVIASRRIKGNAKPSVTVNLVKPITHADVLSAIRTLEDAGAQIDRMGNAIWIRLIIP